MFKKILNLKMIKKYNNENIKIFKIYRWDPEKKIKPFMESYAVDVNNCGPSSFIV